MRSLSVSRGRKLMIKRSHRETSSRQTAQVIREKVVGRGRIPFFLRMVTHPQ